MAFEVVPRPGQLRTRDVRVVLGPRFTSAEHVDVLVLGRPGEQPSTGRILLADLPGGGRGVHRGLVCPRCRAPKQLLLTDGGGGLGCTPCLRRRTRRQAERSLADWNKYDGEAEDELFRCLSGPRANCPGTLGRARDIADEIVEGDRDRIAALAPDVHAALTVAMMET
ncbi:hypothetical protein WMF31_37725 [Sorangium sp. So ce1036]|uniref:hypothetical protein n=1 Tax=Sorangium sp. So ce1036 TaxID=3133328 RepID=UPI003F0F5311